MRASISHRWISALIASALAALSPIAAYAGGVVTNCGDDSQLSSLLAGGGTVTFDCGTRTIILSSTKTITNFVTIDGGGTITLSGDNARRLFVVNAGARLELDDIVIEKGFSKAADGGAILNLDTVSLVNCTFRSNATTAEWSGGAIYSSSHLAAFNTTFTDNEAGSGGAIAIASNINQTNITASHFDRNFATATDMSSGYGGALLATDGATATVNSSTFTNNEAREGGAINVRSGSRLFADGTLIDHNMVTGNGDGGGIKLDISTANLTNLTLSRNVGGQGGAIATFAGEVLLTTSTLSGNSAFYGAGYYTFLGTHTLTNVTVSANDASSSGGGIYNSRGTMTLTNVTLAGNIGGNGLTGGIVNSGGGPDPDLMLKNVLIAKGATGSNCGFGIAPSSAQFNLSDDNTCGFGSGRDNVDLLLGPLADNGGTTQTHLPGPGSPAIGNGANAGCPPNDQRGVMRPQGPLCDVGAVEVEPATPTPTRSATPSPTQTPTHTATATPTATATATLSPTRSATATARNTPPPSATATAVASPTAVATPSASPSATARPPGCAGDCDDSGSVTINELVTVVAIALGDQPLSACSIADEDGSSTVTIDEILRAVNSALAGCPSAIAG